MRWMRLRDDGRTLVTYFLCYQRHRPSVRHMSVKIGFVLLTHNKPQQALRLVKKLNSMFDAPPIAWHHDFAQCNLTEESFSKNIHFVRPHLRTAWAQFSIVEAGMAALKLLFELENPPDFFYLLSGADYPIKPADKILRDLSMSEYDAHMNFEKICFNQYKFPWHELCYKRYCTVKFSIPLINRKLKLTRRLIRISHPVLSAPFLPFSRNFACFAGETWFCANQFTAEYLIDFHKTKPGLAKHFRRADRALVNHQLRSYDAICPEEAYYQTILCNSPRMKVSQNHWRYIDWSQGGAHPKTLMMEDLPLLQKSTAHFARKFDIDVDQEIFDALDELT